jgi:uncharacterized protein YhaN
MSVFLREQKLRLMRLQLAKDETELEIAKKEEQIAILKNSVAQSDAAIQKLSEEIKQMEQGG